MKKSFTLIEMLVAVGIIMLVLPAVFVIIFGITREQLKVKKLSIVKNDGDYALAIISNTIKNHAFSIHSGQPTTDDNKTCFAAASSNFGPVYFQDNEESWFHYDISSDQISSSSSVLASPVELNSTRTIVSNFVLSCEREAIYSAPVVTISFDICYVNPAGTCESTRPEETAQLHYETKIKLRNF
ncbi:MAG: PilW family protein [Patescibacteria group bacterium]